MAFGRASVHLAVIIILLDSLEDIRLPFKKTLRHRNILLGMLNVSFDMFHSRSVMTTKLREESFYGADGLDETD
ncbi:MAG: hypothetical protein NTV56_00370 [Alphaproteobacteria bacterium]|nr:hypothetical protein [Alphaproteobacteria bacterium]